MSLVLNANGLYEYVKPPINRSKASLGSAKDILSSIAIPGNFTHYSTLRDLPTGIQVVQTRNDNVNVWLDTVVNEFGKKEEEASGFEFNLFGLDVGAVVTGTVGAVTDFGTSVFETSVDIFEATGAAIAGGFNTAVDFFETTGANIAGAAVSVWNTAENWIVDTATVINEVGASIGGAIANGASECWDWICGAASATWGVIQSVGADIFNFAISLIEGIASLLETIVDLAIIVGSAVGSVFTGAWDLGTGIGNWISGNGFQMSGATEAMWDWTMGFTAENWTGMGFDAFYEHTGVGHWLDDNAHEWFKSDGIACQIGQGLGYMAGIFALTIVTGGTVSPILMAGGLSFSSSTTGAWAEMRDQSWEGIERAYANGDIDQATYESMVAIKDMSTEDWQQIESMYQNGELPKEDYDAMLQIREISTDWKTVENYFGGINTGIEEGITTAAITALTLGIGSKVMSGLNKVLPKLTQVAPKGLQTVLNKLFSNVVEEGTESLVEFGGNLATTGSLDQALAQTGGVPGLAISMGIGMLLDVDIPGRKLAGNVDIPMKPELDLPSKSDIHIIKPSLDIDLSVLRQKLDLQSNLLTLLDNNYKVFGTEEDVIMSNLRLFDNKEYSSIINYLSEGYDMEEMADLGVHPDRVANFNNLLASNNLSLDNIRAFQQYTAGSNMILGAKRGIPKEEIYQSIIFEYESRLAGYGIEQDVIDKIAIKIKNLDYSLPLHNNYDILKEYIRQFNIDKKQVLSIFTSVQNLNRYYHLDETLASLDQGLTSQLPDDIKLYRAIKSKYLFESFPDINSLEDLVGKKISENGYSSTASLYDSSFAKYDDYDVVFEVFAPKGSQGMDVTPFSVYATAEGEVLLNSNDMLVIDVKPDIVDYNGKTKTIVEVLLLSKNTEVDNIPDIDIQNTRYNFAESIKNIDDFKQLDATAQSVYLQNCSIKDISTILFDGDLSLIYRDAINTRITESQDYIFSRLNVITLNDPEISNVCKYISKDLNLIKSLSDDNLIKLVANMDADNPNLVNLIAEVNSRVAQGNVLIDRYDNIERNLNREERHDLNMAIEKFTPSTVDEIVRLARESWAGMPDFIKAYNFDYGTYPMATKAYVARLYNSGILDETSFSILKEMYDVNPNVIKIFNFELLNKDIVDLLGKDYVIEMGSYRKISNRLISLYNNDPKLFEAFAAITAKSYADDSLLTFYQKNEAFLNFFVENIHSMRNIDSSILTGDDFINYMLYSQNMYSTGPLTKRISLEFETDYARNFALECDQRFDELYADYKATGIKKLSDSKEAFFQKYYSISYVEAQTFIAKYGDYIDAVGNSESSMLYSTVLRTFKNVDSCNDMEYLRMLYDTDRTTFNAEAMIHLDSSIKQVFTQTYVDSLSITEDMINTSNSFRTVTYNGQEIKIINLEDDFSFLVYSSDSGFGTNGIKPLINDSYIDSWYQPNDATLHGLPTSYITSSNIGSAPVQGNGVLYAFTNIDASNIAIMGPYDINSNINMYGFSSGNKQIYIPASDMSSNTLRVYNEVVLDRSAIKPDSIILYDDATPQAIENAYKAAAEWNIPIVSISKVDLATSNLARIDSHLNYFDISNNPESLISAIELYESNVSGFRLNADVVEGATDATSAINNDIVADMFKPDKIEATVKEYIDSLETSSNNIAKGNELINMLEVIQKKYEIANDNGTDLVTHTQSSIDLEGLIDYTKKMIGGN